MAKKLYIGNLSFQMENEDLGNLFSQCGTVESAQVVIDNQTGRKRGFGFVEMSTDEEAEAAISTFNGQMVEGRQITVALAKGPSERGSGGGERRGGGGGGYRDRDGGGYGGGNGGGGRSRFGNDRPPRR